MSLSPPAIQMHASLCRGGVRRAWRGCAWFLQSRIEMPARVRRGRPERSLFHSSGSLARSRRFNQWAVPL